MRHRTGAPHFEASAFRITHLYPTEPLNVTVDQFAARSFFVSSNRLLCGTRQPHAVSYADLSAGPIKVGDMIIVSTDGSCLRNPGGAIGWAWVNHTGPHANGGAPVGTNQVAELRAVLEAIVAHPGAEPLLIESDSQYAIKCASEWLPGWKRKNWRTSSGDEVKNLDLIQRIDRAVTERPGPVRFRWVRGHVGNYYNELADALAGEAAREAAASAAVETAAPKKVRKRTEPATERPASEREVMTLF